MKTFPHTKLVMTALVLLAVTGCSSVTDAMRTSSSLTVTTSPATPALSPTTVDFGAGPTTVLTPSTTAAQTQASEGSASAQTGPDLGGIACGEVLNRAQIGNRVGAGFATMDIFQAIAPDPATGVLEGLDCQYAVAEPGQWTVQVQLIRYTEANDAAIAIQRVVDQRAQSGGASTSQSIAGRPAYLVISTGGFLIMQLGADILSIEIPPGILDGPRSQIAISALAEFCLGNFADLS